MSKRRPQRIRYASGNGVGVGSAHARDPLPALGDQPFQAVVAVDVVEAELDLGLGQLFQPHPDRQLAKVNGFAFGGGFEVTGLCDLAIASDTALFGLSEINFGIFPAGGATWAVTHNLPRKQALYYILTGDTLTGKQAEEYGLWINVALKQFEKRSYQPGLSTYKRAEVAS